MSTPEPALTPALLRALTVLRDQCDRLQGTAQVPRGFAYPRSVAMDLWPDSPGWRKRSRRGAGASCGALGAGMPMAAASLMRRLAKLGLADASQTGRWTITLSGRASLEQQ